MGGRYATALTYLPAGNACRRAKGAAVVVSPSGRDHAADVQSREAERTSASLGAVTARTYSVGRLSGASAARIQSMRWRRMSNG